MKTLNRKYQWLDKDGSRLDIRKGWAAAFLWVLGALLGVVLHAPHWLVYVGLGFAVLNFLTLPFAEKQKDAYWAAKDIGDTLQDIEDALR